MLRSVRRHVPALLVAAFFLLPLLVMVSGSLRPAGLAPPRGVEVVPSSPTLDGYQRLAELVPLGTWLLNSGIVATLAVVLTVLVASWAAFGMRMLPTRARRTAVVVTIGLLLVPVTAVWTTRFQVLDAVGLVDSLGALVVPALTATTPFYVLIYLWSFTGIPDTQLEAARLEGASTWRLWLAVAMPQARLATLAVAVLSFGVYWSNFIDPLLYIDSPSRYTLPLGLRLLQQLNPTDFPLLLAGAVIATLPPVLVFLLAQRIFLDDPLQTLRRVRP